LKVNPIQFTSLAAVFSIRWSLHYYYVNIIIMKSKYLIPEFLITCLLLYASAFALKEETTQGKVMQIKDGDTIVVSPVDGGQFFICRLYGIDAHEATKQPYGDESTKELKRLILGQEVAVEIKDRDKYGREVCVVIFRFKPA